MDTGYWMPMTCGEKNSSGRRRVSTRTRWTDLGLIMRSWAALLGLSLSLLLGCSTATPTQSATIMPTPSETEILRDQQVRALWKYDNALNHTPNECDTLCEHQGRICALSTQICDVIAKQPRDHRAPETCQTANDTCRDSTNRIPDICLCDA